MSDTQENGPVSRDGSPALGHCPWRHTDASEDTAMLIVFPGPDEDGEIASLHSEKQGVYLDVAAARSLRAALTDLLKDQDGYSKTVAVHALREAAAAWRKNGLAWDDPDEETNTDLRVARALDKRADRIERGETP